MQIVKNYPLLALCFIASYIPIFACGWIFRSVKAKDELEEAFEEWNELAEKKRREGIDVYA